MITELTIARQENLGQLAAEVRHSLASCKASSAELDRLRARHDSLVAKHREALAAYRQLLLDSRDYFLLGTELAKHDAEGKP